MREMMEEVIETLYKGELEEHLGYEKHGDNPNNGNSRNSHSERSVRISVLYNMPMGSHFLLLKKKVTKETSP